MSLVAYGYESGESDNEPMDEDKPQVAADAGSDRSAQTSLSQTVSHIQVSTSNKDVQDHPKQKSLIDQEEEELEDIVQPKVAQMTNIVKPAKRPNQPVRITIPALIKDDLDDKPVVKKQKLNSTKCGLFDLLPKPHNVTVKEANRILIPHSLTKNNTIKQEMTKAYCAKTNIQADTSPTRKQKAVGVDYNSDSDDEAGDVNFFSIGQDSFENKTEMNKGVSNTGSVFDTPSLTESKSERKLICTNVYHPSLTDSDDGEITELEEVTKPVEQNVSEICLPSSESSSRPSSLADLPLQFAGQTNIGAWNVANSPFSNYSTYSTVSKMYQDLYPERNKDSVTTSNTVPDSLTEGDELGPAMEHASFDDNIEFQKMQGRWGRMKEEVNVIDVDCNDVTGQDDMMKNISQETDDNARRSKKNEGPTSQQRKKHQITYLAFQAKERELDLKNQWSQNRMTKRQTQAKYGF